MPSLTVKLYSVFYKYHLRQQLHRLSQPDGSGSGSGSDPFGITSRPEETIVPANPSFQNGVATKDIHVDPLSSLSLRIFLPDSVLGSPESSADRRDGDVYGGYSPPPQTKAKRSRKLPVVLQFHGGGFVGGSNASAANDAFCRRMARLCDAMVVAVGYRLAPESRYPAAFEDGLKVLNWLGKQANLASLRNVRSVRANRRIFDSFGESMAEPWLAAHGDPSRCVLLGVSSGANIADYVARKAVKAGKLLDPIKVVAQVLMYPFFAGNIPTKSEIKLSNSYIYDKAMCSLAWMLFLPEKEFDLDHPAANPLVFGTELDLKHMTPTLTVVAEHDLMRDRAIAYSEELRRANVDAPLLDYKDGVHEFATLGVLLHTPQALACADDIAIWVKKYISLRGHEFSY
ncbi:Arylacetamide deacetylase [Parasponia andersonii]|uniref:Arylacetamide deacetylase n=1 Tax=Parasponia andersonii TaxID=3476 RepID=A0A2P5AT41_PARAD|nr:Arylacetamide deacetylase [Parasponia andersonii]